MSAAASSSSVHASSNHQGWITPQEQLELLASPMVRQRLYENRELRKSVPEGIIDQIAASAIQSTLKSIKGETRHVPTLFDMLIEQHLVEPRLLPANQTNWYKALSRLGALTEKIPPLPNNIHQIMDGKCPIYGDKKQPDGTYLKIKDTHFLALIPEEFGTLNRLERDILIPYGEREYPEGENPLRFRYFSDRARYHHGGTPFAPTHWVLMTNTVLPESRKKSWAEQGALVEALSRKALVTYEVPTLQESFTAITTDMVATGERRYQVDDDRNLNVPTYTRVKETGFDGFLVVGGFSPSGVDVNDYFAYDDENVGVAALRKF